MLANHVLAYKNDTCKNTRIHTCFQFYSVVFYGNRTKGTENLDAL